MVEPSPEQEVKEAMIMERIERLKAARILPTTQEEWDFLSARCLEPKSDIRHATGWTCTTDEGRTQRFCCGVDDFPRLEVLKRKVLITDVSTL